MTSDPAAVGFTPPDARLLGTCALWLRTLNKLPWAKRIAEPISQGEEVAAYLQSAVRRSVLAIHEANRIRVKWHE